MRNCGLKQEAQLLQRDSATHLSVEILQKNKTSHLKKTNRKLATLVFGLNAWPTLRTARGPGPQPALHTGHQSHTVRKQTVRF